LGLGALSLCACTQCGFQSDPGIKVVVPAMPTTLDWNTSDPNSWANYPIALATMVGLTVLSEDNQVLPGLATAWEQAIDAQGRERYTFHLRPEVKWSDGVTPLVADDFVLGWRRAVVGRERGEMQDLLGAERVLELLDSGATRAEVAGAVEQLGVRALDPHTLQVTLSSPRNYFLARVANVYLFFPAPSQDLRERPEAEVRDYFDHPQRGRPLSLGPFRVDRWDRAGERVRLVRNAHSSLSTPLGPGEEPGKTITLVKSDVAGPLYDRGRVDFLFLDNPIALREALPPDVRRQPLLSTYFLALNTRRPPLDRPEIRRAIAGAIDRAALFQGLLPAARLANSLLPPGLPGQVEGIPQPRPDSRAQPLLRSAPLPLRPLRLVYRAGESFIPEVAVAERLKRQLAASGVQLELDPRYDFFSELARIAPDGFPAADLYLRRIGADYAHPKTFFTFFEPGGNHYTGWEQIDRGEPIRRFEELLRTADRQTEPTAAAGLYAEAEGILLDRGVIVPLYHPDRYYRVRPKLIGLRVDPFNFLSLRQLRIRSEGVAWR
jgi:peptide/nickel transport system substrate-binding protein